MLSFFFFFFFFFFNDTATTEIYTLSSRRSSDLSTRPSSEDITAPARASCTWASLLMSVLRSEEHTSELQSRPHLVCRLLLEKKKKKTPNHFLIKKKKNTN